MAKNIAHHIGRLLRSRGLTLAIAESCTGGLLGHRITQVPGSSEYFSGGVITYVNDAKLSLLGVKEETLKRHGAVSRRTAAEMADGVRRRFGSDVGVSITGIAGPAGGTARKPVGLVYIGVADNRGVAVKRFTFPGTRHLVKTRAAGKALQILLDRITVN